jgi:membrane-bound serine protease (ClpP class)
MRNGLLSSLSARFAILVTLGASLVLLNFFAGSWVRSADGQSKPKIAYSIQLAATIDPATESWVTGAIGDAEKAHASLIIIRLDTPGGLDSSMRSIIQRMISSPLPVVVYVSPNGARAASAGLYITQASDVAAMAPQTNIGSATPILEGSGGGSTDVVLGRKIRNDARAYVSALALAHGRNAKLAALMVTKATNVPAPVALNRNLIDIIASSQENLLQQLNGFHVKGPKAQVLDTTGMQIQNHDMPLQYQILELIVNPTVAYLLLLVGMIGIAFEIFHPGAYVPGIVGVISLLLGLYGTAQLPVRAVGVILLILGVGMIFAEIKVPSHGFLGVAGIISLIIAGLLLFDTNSSAFETSAPIVIGAGLLIGAGALFAVLKVVQARHKPVQSGQEALVGQTATVRVPLDPIGQVFVKGALWKARTDDPELRIDKGAKVTVRSVKGLTLEVGPLVAPLEAESKEER